MKAINGFLLLLFVLAAFCACHKEDTPAIQMEEISGYCFYYNSDGNRSTDNSGITVSIEGDTISTTTKSNGSWNISHLKQGVYTIAFSKPGFGTMKLVGKNLVGGFKLLDTISLCPILNYQVTLSKVINSDGNTVVIDGYFNGSLPDCPCCHVFFGKTQNVSSDTGTYIQQLPIFAPGSIEGPGNGFDCSFTNQILKDKGFVSGDSVYAVAYPDFAIPITYNSWDVGAYYVNSTTQVFPNVCQGKSNVMSFVLP